MIEPARMRRGCAMLLALAAACGREPSARCAEPTLAAIGAEVEAATRPARLPPDFAARAAAVRRLVGLHDRIVGDLRFATTPALQALRARVAARLAHLGGRLERDLSAAARRPPLAAPTAGGRAADARQLIDLIQATVRPAAWDVNGGTGSIRFFDNGHGLVVSAPEEVHEELGDLLRKLR